MELRRFAAPARSGTRPTIHVKVAPWRVRRRLTLRRAATHKPTEVVDRRWKSLADGQSRLNFIRKGTVGATLMLASLCGQGKQTRPAGDVGNFLGAEALNDQAHFSPGGRQCGKEVNKAVASLDSCEAPNSGFHSEGNDEHPCPSCHAAAYALGWIFCEPTSSMLPGGGRMSICMIQSFTPSDLMSKPVYWHLWTVADQPIEVLSRHPN